MNDYLSNALIKNMYYDKCGVRVEDDNIMRSDTNNNEIFLDFGLDMYGYIRNISDQSSEMYDLYHIAYNIPISKKSYIIRNVPIKDNDVELQFNSEITDNQVRKILSMCNGFSDKFNYNINIYRGNYSSDIFITNGNDTARIQYIKGYYDSNYRVDFYKDNAIWYKNDKNNNEESYDVYDVDGKIISKQYYENHKDEFQQY